MGYQYDKVTRVAPIFYFETAGALVIDIFVFKDKFSILSIFGLVLVLGMFGVIIVSAYREEKQENKEE